MFRHAQMHTIPKSLSHARATVLTKFPFQDHHLHHPNGSLPLRRIWTTMCRQETKHRYSTSLLQHTDMGRQQEAGATYRWQRRAAQSSGKEFLENQKLHFHQRLHSLDAVATPQRQRAAAGRTACLLMGVNLCSIISCSLCV